MNYMDINAFPSLHVAISSLISFLIGKEKRNLRWVFWSWSLIIALSKRDNESLTDPSAAFPIIINASSDIFTFFSVE